MGRSETLPEYPLPLKKDSACAVDVKLLKGIFLGPPVQSTKHEKKAYATELLKITD